MQRQTDRQRNIKRERETETERETDRQTEKLEEGERDRESVCVLDCFSIILLSYFTNQAQSIVEEDIKLLRG